MSLSQATALEPISFMLEVCICTHNPRLPVLCTCVEAIATQISPPPFRVLLVDNASHPPLAESLLNTFWQRGIPAALIREPRLGLTAARVAAFQQTRGEWLVFIDDDNVVASDFLRVGNEFALAHPEVGAFGGRVSLAPDIKVPQWMTPLLAWMGVKEEGDEVLIDSTIEWGRHDPPGAGLWVRRAVLERFASRARADPSVFELGRRGNGLASCEDSVIVKGAQALGFDNAYVPSLRVDHHVKQGRFAFWHAIRSLSAYGKSIALYERIMMLRGDQIGKSDRPSPFLAGWKAFNSSKDRSVRYAATLAVHLWSYERSRRTLERDHPELAPTKEALQNLLPFLRTGVSAHSNRGAIVVTEGREEFAVYGPYWTLPPGNYEMRAVMRPQLQTGHQSSVITAQVTAEGGTRVFVESKWRLNQYRLTDSQIPAEFRLPFSLINTLPRAARTIETRIFTPGNASFSLLSLCVVAKSESQENDWFPYLYVGECGIHLGTEIVVITDMVGCIACTPPMPIVRGHYELIVDMSTEPNNRNLISIELWSGPRHLATKRAEGAGDQRLLFHVTNECSENGVKLRINVGAPTKLSIRGIMVNKLTDSPPI